MHGPKGERKNSEHADIITPPEKIQLFKIYKSNFPFCKIIQNKKLKIADDTFQYNVFHILKNLMLIWDFYNKGFIELREGKKIIDEEL